MYFGATSVKQQNEWMDAIRYGESYRVFRHINILRVLISFLMFILMFVVNLLRVFSATVLKYCILGYSLLVEAFIDCSFTIHRITV